MRRPHQTEEAERLTRCPYCRYYPVCTSHTVPMLLTRLYMYNMYMKNFNNAGNRKMEIAVRAKFPMFLFCFSNLSHFLPLVVVLTPCRRSATSCQDAYGLEFKLRKIYSPGTSHHSQLPLHFATKCNANCDWINVPGEYVFLSVISSSGAVSIFLITAGTAYLGPMLQVLPV